MTHNNTLRHNSIIVQYIVFNVSGERLEGLYLKRIINCLKSNCSEFGVSIRKAVHNGSGDNDEYVRLAGNVCIY